MSIPGYIQSVAYINPPLLSFFKVKRIGPSGGGEAESYNAGVRPLHAPFEMQPYSLIKDPVKVYSETDSPIFSTVYWKPKLLWRYECYLSELQLEGSSFPFYRMHLYISLMQHHDLFA